MPVTINLNGNHALELNLEGDVTVSMRSPGVVAVNYTPPPTNTHAEPLTDGNGNIIFAATVTMGGDVIVVEGVPN